MTEEYGIKITMPDGDTLAKSHLLGQDWATYRWFGEEQIRDRIYQQMLAQPDNYRLGDKVSAHLKKVER